MSEGYTSYLVNALRIVMFSLPAPGKPKRQTALDVALHALGSHNPLRVNGGQKAYERDVAIVKKFIASSPTGYGAERTESFWQIVFEHFSHQEAVDCYLAQFPRTLTPKQERLIRCHLQLILQQRAIQDIDVDACIRRQQFIIRLQPRPKQEKPYFFTL